MYDGETLLEMYSRRQVCTVIVNKLYNENIVHMTAKLKVSILDTATALLGFGGMYSKIKPQFYIVALVWGSSLKPWLTHGRVGYKLDHYKAVAMKLLANNSIAMQIWSSITRTKKSTVLE